jgi:threonyl-tRNA synthetase
MIHRVVLGSIERFIGVITEHFAGAYPVWLTPVQVKVLPISEKVMAYAKIVNEKLNAAGIRCELDQRSEKIGYKIREAQLQKIPYMVIVGEKEAEEGTISVRNRKEGDKGSLALDAFIDEIKNVIATKSLEF